MDSSAEDFEQINDIVSNDATLGLETYNSNSLESNYGLNSSTDAITGLNNVIVLYDIGINVGDEQNNGLLGAISNEDVTDPTLLGAGTVTVRTWTELSTQVGKTGTDAPDIIYLSPGVYTVDTTINIARNVQIIGLGSVTINAGNRFSGQFFTSDEGTSRNPLKIFIANMTLYGANTGDSGTGGAMHFKNDYLQLNLTNITFSHNDARLGGGLRIGSDKNTVGLYATLVNCKFLKMLVQEVMNLMWYNVLLTDYLVMIDCYCESNTAPFSGGVHLHRSGAEFYNCTFITNEAQNTADDSGYGGAVSSLENGLATDKKCYYFENSTFKSNLVKSYGGGIEIKGNNVYVVNCTFIGNTGRYGSPISIRGTNTTLKGSKFYNNTDFEYGAVYIEGADAKVEDSYFENNTDSKRAAIYILGDNAEFNNITCV